MHRQPGRTGLIGPHMAQNGATTGSPCRDFPGGAKYRVDMFTFSGCKFPKMCCFRYSAFFRNGTHRPFRPKGPPGPRNEGPRAQGPEIKGPGGRALGPKGRALGPWPRALGPRPPPPTRPPGGPWAQGPRGWPLGPRVRPPGLCISGPWALGPSFLGPGPFILEAADDE